MVDLSLLLLLLLSSSTDGGSAREMRHVPRKKAPTLPPPLLHLPVFVDSRLPLVEKEYFSPSAGTGLEPLPEHVREVLLPAWPTTSPPDVSGDSVTASCTPNHEMHVQVERSLLGTGDPRPRITLGTCQASRSTRDHLHFEYDLSKCGTKRTIRNNQVTYSNTLQYDAPRLLGFWDIRRAVPFTMSVGCNYNRYQYSYQIGYIPKMQMRKIFKQMKSRVKFILTPRNAKWERLFPSDRYMLGKPMYFEAESPSMYRDERLYLQSCYATPGPSHTSTPQFPVVTNFGCMDESKHNRSRFIQSRNNAVRFSLDAFLFKGMAGQQLYMHCTMFVGGSVPTPTAKSCNYDIKARRWVELYGEDSVCSCCDSNCTSAASTVSKVISSKSWTIESKVKTTTAPKRKTLSTTTTTTTTAQQEASREVPEWRTTTLQPAEMEVTPLGKVENTVREFEWPFGGRGMKWFEVEEEEEEQVEEEEETQVGSAVVEAVEEEKQVEEEEKQVGSALVVEEEEEKKMKKKVTYTIFEEIFQFDK